MTPRYLEAPIPRDLATKMVLVARPRQVGKTTIARRVLGRWDRGARVLKKLPKAYLWDWSLVSDRAARFENLLAAHLLKLCHLLEDVDRHQVALHYIRDHYGREVDFLVTAGRKAWFAVEVKLSQTTADPSLLFFRERLRIPWAYQAVLDGQRDIVDRGVRIVPAARFLAALV